LGVKAHPHNHRAVRPKKEKKPTNLRVGGEFIRLQCPPLPDEGAGPTTKWTEGKSGTG